MRHQLSQPSLVNGYARSKGESVRPDLWDGLFGAYLPALGIQGNTLYDAACCGNGTISGATWSGNTLVFPGTSGNKVNLGSEINYASGDSFTRLMRIYVSGDGTYQHLVGKRNSLATETSYQIRLGDASADRKLMMFIQSGATAVNYKTGSAIATGSWVVIAVRFTFPASGAAGTCDFFIDGTKYSITGDRTLPGAINDPNVVDTFGDRYAGGMPFVGSLSHLLMWNKLLTDKQIMDLTLDPSLLLRQKTFVPMYVPGVVATFKPAWARHCNKLIGAY